MSQTCSVVNERQDCAKFNWGDVLAPQKWRLIVGVGIDEGNDSRIKVVEEEMVVEFRTAEQEKEGVGGTVRDRPCGSRLTNWLQQAAGNRTGHFDLNPLV